MKYVILVFSVSTLFISSCSKKTDTTTLTCSGTKSFATDVNPIIQSTCVASGCHDASSHQTSFLTYAGVFADKTSIRSQVNDGIMPKNSTLTAAQKNAILCWIDAGAPNN